MPKVDRLKELEKAAEKLGIGTVKDVDCVGCQKTIKSDKAIILTDDKVTKHMCPDCYSKVLNGDLKKESTNEDLIKKLIEMEGMRKDWGDQKVNTGKKYNEIGEIQPVIWEPKIGDYPQYTISRVAIDGSGPTQGSSFMALVPQENTKYHGNR